MRLPAVLLPLLLAAACSAPPQKEIDLAQGAIDAARAAGAEQYAAEPLAAATAALAQAHAAVAGGDHRLALTRALDAHDRALDAAKAAADGKARARSAAEAAVAAAESASRGFEQRGHAAERARVDAKTLATARRAMAAALDDVQEARALIESGDYLGAREAAAAIPGRIAKEIAALEAAIARRAQKPVRRGR